jgi:hypothetical protein
MHEPDLSKSHLQVDLGAFQVAGKTGTLNCFMHNIKMQSKVRITLLIDASKSINVSYSSQRTKRSEGGTFLADVGLMHNRNT